MNSTTTHTPFTRLIAWVTGDVSSGALMIGAALIGLLRANTPWRDTYASISSFAIGPESLGLHLSLGTWAADGLLAIFFFVVGVELKQEIVAGSLRNPREAAVPVLAIFGRALPVALRVFLLTLAVVDDLLAIVVIALFYTNDINLLAIAGALIIAAIFAVVARAKQLRWWILLPLALIAWGLVHESGIHATIAGVLLGFCIPAKTLHGEASIRTQRVADAVNPVSAGVALPVFGFFAAGVTVVGGGDVFAQPVVPAILFALVVGKIAGVLGLTALVTKVTPLRLADGIGIRDRVPIGLLTGIGFTVALLITELSFEDEALTAASKVAVLMASAVAAVLGATALRWDARKLRRRDMNNDGVPDAPSVKIGE